MISREDNVRVFEDTIDMCETNDHLQKSIEVSAADQRMIPEDEELPIPEKRFEETLVRISKRRSIEAAYVYNGKKTCVLNFASATRPGGGVTWGSFAQEESICRISTLYPCLNRQELWDSFYTPHREADNPIYNADIIYTPNVTAFKSDSITPETMPESDWMTLDIVTCAAPNLRRDPSNAMNPEGGSKQAHLSDFEVYEIHKERGRRILCAAAQAKCDILILGAFGCGAFYNSPKAVAAAYKKILPEFDGVFGVIEFAVFCTPKDMRNYDEFDKILDLS